MHIIIFSGGTDLDKHLRETIQKHIDLTLDALRKNRFEAEYIETPELLLQRLDELMPQGCSCSVGGSVTLDETGVLDYLKSGRFEYYDRYHPQADQEEVFHQAMSCDVYLTSSNAITEEGELYNIDGHCNRLAALIWGPKKVIVVAGYNKIVTNLDAAADRMRSIAAPANARRLSKKTPCVAIGRCQDCSSPERICSQELISRWQRHPGRIHVIILGGEYGY